MTRMIYNFRDKLTEDVFNGLSTRYSRKLPSELHKKAVIKLDQLNAATKVETIKVPPGNKLSKLEGHLSEFWRIKIDKDRTRNNFRFLRKGGYPLGAFGSEKSAGVPWSIEHFFRSERAKRVFRFDARNGSYFGRDPKQWAVVFRWENGNAYDVYITDYH